MTDTTTAPAPPVAKLVAGARDYLDELEDYPAIDHHPYSSDLTQAHELLRNVADKLHDELGED